MTDSRFTRRIFVIVSVLFFLSGMCGLIYQILWTRILSLLFGHTTFAISTVITAFMAGLAAGSYCFGKWTDDDRSPIGRFLKKHGDPSLFLAYGLIELSIGLYALVTPFLFTVVERIYLLFPSLSFFSMGILRFVLCVIVLTVPTFLMGGTLPLLSRFLIRSFSELGRKLAFLYFINTIGAAAGTFLAGFFFIRLFGVTATLVVTALINIAIGLFVYTLWKVPMESYTEPAEGMSTGAGREDQGVNGRQAVPEKMQKTLFVVFAFTGFAAMVYELCWTRALVLTLGSSTYAFSTMLATFLIGLALGSILYGVLSKRLVFDSASFGKLELIIGFFCLLTVPLLGVMPFYFLMLFPLVKGSYYLVTLANFVLSFAVMIIPTTLMGFAFPLVGRLCTRSVVKIGRSIGDIYAVNTLGCILGAFLAGFVMIPFIGVQNSLRVAVWINVICGLVVLYRSGSIQKKMILALSSLLILISVGIPAWNPAVMTSGAAIYAEDFVGKVPDFRLYKDNVLFYKDGISSTVSVYKEGNGLLLKINGKTDASTTFDMPTQMLLGYLPVLYHENPKDVFVVGLGSGITARAVLDFPSVERVICAELEPAVIEANRFFASLNKNVLADPRFHVLIEDGRNALLASTVRYDIIISEPSNPWIAGIASLYTNDFYRMAKDRLKPGGIFSQWLQLYRMHPDDLKMVLKTFFSVFPHGQVWQGASCDVLLIGSDRELTFDYAKLASLFERNGSFREALTGIGIRAPDVIFSHYITGVESVRPLLSTAALNTDDVPVLEFSAPRSLYLDTVAVNQKELYRYKSVYLPRLTNEPAGQILSPAFYLAMFKRTEDASFLEKVLSDALHIYPDNSELVMLKARGLIRTKAYPQAEKLLRQAAAKDRSKHVPYVYLARIYREQGQNGRAEEMYDEALRRSRIDQGLLIEYAGFLLAKGDIEKARIFVDDMIKRNPGLAGYEFMSARVYMKMKQYDKAVEVFLNLLEKTSGDRLEISRNLFVAYRELKQYPKMLEIGRELLDANPKDIDILLALGRYFMETGKPREGRKMLNRVLQADPLSTEAAGLLADAEARR